MAGKRFWLLAIISVATGMINGLLGIGGGTIMIPALVSLLGMTQHKAHGTTLAVILPTSLASAVVYHSQNNLDFVLAGKLALAGMIGAYLGAKLMNRLPAARLRQVFALFMMLAGLRMIIG